MAAITRWVQYDIDAGGVAVDGNTGCQGSKGYSVSTAASVGDSFTIGSNNNRLYLDIDSQGGSTTYVTVQSGTDLDPRFIAKDITEKLHEIGASTYQIYGWQNAICRWENTPAHGNRFKIYSGSLGSSSAVTVGSGTNSINSTIGFSVFTEAGGSTGAEIGTQFDGTVLVSGTYYGFVDETYTVVITNDYDGSARGIDTPVASITYGGVLTTGGVYNYGADTTYTVTIDTTNGHTMGGGTGQVPTMSWASTGTADDSSVDTELLYADHWYKVGTRGLMVKFTDAIFEDGSWDITCYSPKYASGTSSNSAPGTAYFAYSSDRGDMGAAAVTAVSGSYTALGTRGLYISFVPADGADTLYYRDQFTITCSAPAPSAYDISSLNYGNVTVSTESDVKCVMFEIMSGAVQLSTVKFGLQSHGSFSNHNENDSDTYFRFGTVGPGNPKSGKEWYPNVTAADIDSDTPPAFLYATKANLGVVTTADDSESVGNTGLMGDPIWLNIHLGSSETGANSTINNRLYFDYA